MVDFSNLIGKYMYDDQLPEQTAERVEVKAIAMCDLSLENPANSPIQNKGLRLN